MAGMFTVVARKGKKKITAVWLTSPEEEKVAVHCHVVSFCT
jgi:hypothetical protein